MAGNTAPASHARPVGRVGSSDNLPPRRLPNHTVLTIGVNNVQPHLLGDLSLAMVICPDAGQMRKSHQTPARCTR
eukprot:7734104-Lingulodinium_polyedra.AAC.1